MNEHPSVTCTRTYPVRAQQAFRAFTDPAIIPRWWSPDPTIGVEPLTWEPRAEGRWRFRYAFPDGRMIHVGGVFRVVDPPHRLLMTWTWEPPDEHAGIETVVSITFEEADGATTIRVQHDRFPDVPTRDRHDEGWRGTLERLAEVLP